MLINNHNAGTHRLEPPHLAEVQDRLVRLNDIHIQSRITGLNSTEQADILRRFDEHLRTPISYEGFEIRKYIEVLNQAQTELQAIHTHADTEARRIQRELQQSGANRVQLMNELDANIREANRTRINTINGDVQNKLS